MIIEMSKKYPQYEFEKHKGYGTALHIQKIKENGNECEWENYVEEEDKEKKSKAENHEDKEQKK